MLPTLQSLVPPEPSVYCPHIAFAGKLAANGSGEREKAGVLTNSGQSEVIVRQRGDAPRPFDRRVARTQRMLVEAFIALLLERGYRNVRIGDIVTRADVGRSTFYEHFHDKDDILLASMGWMFALLADAVKPDVSRDSLMELATHFWSNRSLARTVLVHPIQPKLERALTTAIEDRLPGALANRRLRAVGIAAAELSILGAWTRGELPASAGEVADALLAVARA
jgi:AcrR family transcriptional regulator